MKILAISDWRIQPLEMIINLVETHKPDAILYAGDDLDRFIPLDKSLLLKTQSHLLKLNYPDLKPVLSKQAKLLTHNFKKFIQEHFQSNDILQKLEIPFYYVNGNDEFVLYTDGTHYSRIHNGDFYINGKRYAITETPKRKITIEEVNPIYFLPDDIEIDMDKDFEIDTFSDSETGIYAPISPNFGNFAVRKNRKRITVFGCECEFGLTSKIKNKPKEYADIYLSHVPPLGTLDLSVRFGMEHIGSKKLLDAIRKYHPKLVICGHSHIWGGIREKIGDTLVVNVSSQDRDPSYGNYALIDTDDWSVEMKPVEEKTMRNIRGMSTIRRNLEKKMGMLNTASAHKHISEALTGLKFRNLHYPNTPENLSKALKKAERLGINTKRVEERIRSLAWKRPKIIRRITISPNKHAFVDVETGRAKGHEPGKLWLIGLCYNRDLRQFLFPKEKRDFLKYLRQNQITSLVSWTNYDSDVLRSILAKANIDIKFIDACQRTSNCVIWYTYKLHELYDALFPDKNDTIDLIPGRIAGLYADHLIISNRTCPYCPPKEEIIEKIKVRNKMDILQMIEICTRLWNG